ncbi:hypothetical protein [Pseudanabaena minima]|uniref:hypothetical protein n=1 Tax=Pseudanabaena minima TaxID=890415 RepID=UPI003DA7AFFA
MFGDGRDSSTGLSPASDTVDRIYGEDGNDIIYGGNEDEPVLVCAKDLLYGGAGNDYSCRQVYEDIKPKNRMAARSAAILFLGCAFVLTQSRVAICLW